MKVLQVNCVYNHGSTGKITHDIHQYLLSQGMESVVCYGRGEKTSEPDVYKICSEIYAKANNLLSRIRGTMYSGCYLSTIRLIRIIQREIPDVVHLQCINGYFVNIYWLLSWLKGSGIRTVLTLHAEFMYTANCGHALDCDKWVTGCGNCPRLKKETRSWFWDRTAVSWQKMHHIYRDWEDLTVVACSDWIRSRAEKSGEIKYRSFCTIHNGIDNSTIFYPRENAGEKIRERYKIGSDKKLVLFAAPAFSEAKGFDLLLKLIDNTKNERFHYILAGEEAQINRENATVVGNIKDQHYLAELYSAADALVICSKGENYPTVCLESISCGTPVVGFDVGGVKETIPEGMGVVVPLGDCEAMKKALLEITGEKPKSAIVEKARRKHCKERMAEDYVRIYKIGWAEAI